MIAQTQLLCTYLAAQVFYYDPRFVIDEDVSYQVADYVLVVFNCVMFFFLALVLAVATRSTSSSERRWPSLSTLLRMSVMGSERQSGL